MHLQDGVLSTPVLIAGAMGAAAGIGLGLQRMDNDRIPRVAVVSCAFFTASLIHVPVGLTSAHLILNGLAGLLLGWSVFPAVFVALVLQWLFFGFGGITTLGANTVIMGVPALICFWLLHRTVVRRAATLVFWPAFLCGMLSIAAGAFLMGLALLLSGDRFTLAAHAVWGIHVPVMVVEGMVTGSIVVFLKKVKPEIFT